MFSKVMGKVERVLFFDSRALKPAKQASVM